MFREYGVRARTELENLLLSKEVWLAVIGTIVVVARWQGVDIPLEVVVSIEALIITVILALSKK